MVRSSFARLLAGIILLGMGNSIGFVQEPNRLASNQNSPLPNAPVPNPAPHSTQSPQGVPPESSSSSDSSPVISKPKYWTNPNPNVQVTVLENTLLRVMTDEPLSTRQTHKGVPLLFTLSEDVVVDNVLIIPRGATIHGTVIESKQAGALTGSPELILQLTSLDLGGHSYPLYTYQFRVIGTSKTKPTEAKIKGGAIIGAIAGGIFNGSAKGNTTAAGKLAGMGTGAALGAGVGTLASAATPGPAVRIPAESQMDFYLASPISVVPAKEKEALRLSQGLRRGGPVLYVRGDTP